MKISNNMVKLFVASLAIVVGQASFAASHGKKMMHGAMKLDNSLSSLSFVSVKKGKVAEAHTIDKLAGTISAGGDVMVKLDTSSVNTNIEIRDERMQKHLFETMMYPSITVTTKVAGHVMGVSRVKGEVTVSLHGVSKNLPFDAIAVRSGDTLVVSSAKPIIIKAADFGLEGGIAMLQKLAKLPSIATAVPVNFVLTFKK